MPGTIGLKGVIQGLHGFFLRVIVPLMLIGYGISGDLIFLYPKPIFYLLKEYYRGLRNLPSFKIITIMENEMENDMGTLIMHSLVFRDNYFHSNPDSEYK